MSRGKGCKTPSRLLGVAGAGQEPAPGEVRGGGKAGGDTHRPCGPLPLAFAPRAARARAPRRPVRARTPALGGSRGSGGGCRRLARSGLDFCIGTGFVLILS